MTTEMPFHIMKVVERIRPKFNIWASARRGLPSEDSMLNMRSLRGENMEKVRFAEDVLAM